MEAHIDYPASSNFTGNAFVNYEKDIYVGYQYFETIPGAYDKVNYEFGYGLSYTSFSISEVTAAQEGEDIVVTARVNQYR